MFVFREEFYVERARPAEGTSEFQSWMAKMRACTGTAEVIISKHRHGPVGTVGTVGLQFETAFTRFFDLAHDAPSARVASLMMPALFTSTKPDHGI
jgi:replicative DNA helicase